MDALVALLSPRPLHDALPILCDPGNLGKAVAAGGQNIWFVPQPIGARSCYRVFWGRYETREEAQRALVSVDRKSTRLNYSHHVISYAVFCLKKKHRRCTRRCH